MLDTPFPPWPAFSEAEADAVRDILLSNRVNYWTGDVGKRFEDRFAASVGCTHGLALNNGTVALELALRALGVGKGDDVIVTPRSYVASAAVPVMLGARPVFADVDLNSQALTAETIEAALTPATRAVIVVHLGGQPADMGPIMSLAQERGLKVIEDCAQAHGARYRNRPVGSFGDIATWSFCQDKIMTTGGEGGMICTSDSVLYDRMWSLRDHGKSRARTLASSYGTDFRWLHEGFGTNARMLEMQSVIGLLQLDQLGAWVEKRRCNAQIIREAAADIPWLRVPEVAAEHAPAFYKAYLFIEPAALPRGESRESVLAAINAAGVPCYMGACPEIYREKAFVDAGLVPHRQLPNAKLLGETSLMFLVHPTLQREHLDKTVAVLNRLQQSFLPEVLQLPV